MPMNTVAGLRILPGLGPIPPTETYFAVTLESVEDARIAHADGGQADAYAIKTTMVRFTTVASAGDSARLPAAMPGMSIVVRNDADTNAMNVFPASGETINAGGADAAFSITAAHEVVFRCYEAGNWCGALSN